MCLRWNLRQILKWTTKSGSAGNRGGSFCACSRRCLDGSFGDKNCRKSGWRGTSGSRAWWNSVGQSLNNYRVGEQRSAVFVSICFPVHWGDLVHDVEAVVLLDVEQKALNGHNERWSLFCSLFLILYVTSLSHCTIEYGTFNGDESLGLNPLGLTELCNQTLSPGLYRGPCYSELDKALHRC